MMSKQQNVDPHQCSICLDDPTDPRRLPCLHVFCHDCLEQLIERRSNQDGLFPCPYCRYEHTLPEIGVDAFPTVEPIIESSVGKHERKIKCRLHNETHDVFCTKCKRPVCKNCLTTTHKQHDAVDLAEFLHVRRETLQITVEELKENIVEINAKLAYLKKEGETLATNKNKDAANVKTQGKLMKDLIDALMKEAFIKIEKEYMEIQNDIKDKLRSMQKKYKDMQNYVSDVESILANNEDDQLLFGLDHLMQKKERILSQTIDTKTVPIQSIFTKGSCNKIKLNEILGTVTVNESQKVKDDGPHSIFPVGPSLKPCLKNHLSSIPADSKHEKDRNLEATNASYYRQTAVRFLRNIRDNRYPNDTTMNHNASSINQSQGTTWRYRILPHIPSKDIARGRLGIIASANHNGPNTPRLLRRLLNINSKRQSI